MARHEIDHALHDRIRIASALSGCLGEAAVQIAGVLTAKPRSEDPVLPLSSCTVARCAVLRVERSALGVFGGPHFVRGDRELGQLRKVLRDLGDIFGRQCPSERVHDGKAHHPRSETMELVLQDGLPLSAQARYRTIGPAASVVKVARSAGRICRRRRGRPRRRQSCGDSIGFGGARTGHHRPTQRRDTDDCEQSESRNPNTHRARSIPEESAQMRSTMWY